MEFEILKNRAIEIRNKYAEKEKAENGQPWTNLNIMEGFVGDVGDLMKLVMAKEGIRKIDDVETKLEHELMDCLWSIIILADKYNIDIEKSFIKIMDDLDARLDSK